jgi:hypothetical protein
VTVYILVLQWIIGGHWDGLTMVGGYVDGEQNVQAFASRDACLAKAKEINSKSRPGPRKGTLTDALCQTMEVRPEAE